jgi:hypothetical protein
MICGKRQRGQYTRTWLRRAAKRRAISGFLITVQDPQGWVRAVGCVKLASMTVHSYSNCIVLQERTLNAMFGTP